MFVPRLLGPGSPKYISESRDAKVDIASKPGTATEERLRVCLDKTTCVGSGGTLDNSRNGS